MPRPPRHLASHVFNAAMIVIGTIAVGWMVHRFGVDALGRLLRSLGWWAAVIVALDLAILCVDAAAVHAFMRPEARMVSYWRVLAAQASGVATNLVTPGGKLGEATKVTMLVGHAPRGRAVSSVVLFNLTSMYISVVVLALGVPLTILIADLPRSLEVAAAIGTGVFVAAVAAVAVLVRRGAIATTIDALAGLRLVGPTRAADWRVRIHDVDGHVRELHTGASPGTRRGMALVLTSRALGWVTLTVVLHAVGLAITAPLLVGVASVGIAVSWAAALVPLGIGVSEGGNTALYAALAGAPLTGFAVALINRGRSLVLAAFGFAVMLVMYTIDRIVGARRAARMSARAGLHPPDVTPPGPVLG